MTPRERVRRLLAGQRVDRIPNGLGGCETAGMHLLAYDNLKKILGVDDPANRMYTFMTNAVFEPSVLAAMEGDVVVLNSRMCPSRLWGEGAGDQWKDEQFWGQTFQVPTAWEFRADGEGSIWWEPGSRKCPPGGIYFDPVPDGATMTLPDLDDQPSPDDFNPSHELPEEFLRELEIAAKWIYENTDYSIACGESAHDLQLHPGGPQAWWMRLASEPEVCGEFLHKAVLASLSHIEQLDQAVGAYCDTLLFAHDLGDLRGVTMGPDLWRQVYKPHYKEWFAGWHARTDMRISMHACGSMRDILGDLVECGLDVFNPIQVSARGMDPEELAQEFGGTVTFYGGALDAVVTPPPTPPQEVYERACRTIRAFNAAGGYIFAGTHNIPGDTPPAHLEAILQAYRDCRDEPGALVTGRA